MRLNTAFALVASLALASGALTDRRATPVSGALMPRASCDNTATSRDCWGDYSIDTDYYTDGPDTGVIQEYWLEVTNVTLAPDGYSKQMLTFNGTYPGPLLTANWGDTFVIHVTNSLENNGTSIHWHGVRQLNTTEFDGVPGITQCPIAPGNTLTYTFKASQYGTTWYHSHFSLQYPDGLVGPLIIYGPATANYDVDLGNLLMTDWGHEDSFTLWYRARVGGPPQLENGLINGQNTYDCTSSTDAACLGTGTRYETTFTNGTRYRFRIINTSVEAYFNFNIDNHTFTVIANDFVPIVPYETDNLVVAIGQRYDVIVEADQGDGDFWLRATVQNACGTGNGNADNILGIIRYNSSSTADPTTTAGSYADVCGDEALADLVPYLAIDVGIAAENETLDLARLQGTYNLWSINSSSLYLNWSAPTTLQAYDGISAFPTDYNVYALDTIDEWVTWVIQDTTGAGGRGPGGGGGGPALDHPIHLHGHDFSIVAQGSGTFDASTSTVNYVNPPRRDVATLPAGGYLVISFLTDNPGSWLVHCHIAWHASQGLALQFVERESEIPASITAYDDFSSTCDAWDSYSASMFYVQDDSGI